MTQSCSAAVPARRFRLLFALALLMGVSRAATRESPNIVLILADDLGWADLGCYGSRFYQTPLLDRLAHDGCQFTQAYAACPVCSPSRASILTGKYPPRLRLTDWLPGRPDQPSQKVARPIIQQHLSLEEETLAEALKNAGYTCASIGKWHLGGDGFLPQNQGFDLNIAGHAAGSPASYFFPYENPKNRAQKIPGLEHGSPGEYLTDRLTEEAIGFIRRNAGHPFFLYLAHYAVHIPLAAKADQIKKFQRPALAGTQTNAIYAAMVESVDAGVGRILEALDSLHLRQNTIVLFTSDNGGLSVKEGPNTPATSNAPLRAGKGYLFEGGIRVPLIASWPGRIPPSVSAVPVSSIDFFPTLSEMCGVTVRSNQVDGVSLWPLLSSGATNLARAALYWHYPHYSNQGGKPGGAIRMGDLKLIESYEDGHLELYDLKIDPGERTNLYLRFPEKALALEQKLDAWRRQTGAQMPHPNPQYHPPAFVQAGAGGLIFLPASRGTVHGQTIRYEPQPRKNTIGYWTNPEDWVSWEFEVPAPGKYALETLQGCGKGSGGSEVAFLANHQIVTTIVQDTGGFQNFRARKIGAFEFQEAGVQTLEVRAQGKPGLAVMDLRSVTLRPVAE